MDPGRILTFTTAAVLIAEGIGLWRMSIIARRLVGHTGYHVARIQQRTLALFFVAQVLLLVKNTIFDLATGDQPDPALSLALALGVVIQVLALIAIMWGMWDLTRIERDR